MRGSSEATYPEGGKWRCSDAFAKNGFSLPYAEQAQVDVPRFGNTNGDCRF